MELHDLVAQGVDPLCGRRVALVVAEVEVGLHGGDLERADERRGEVGLHPQVVPHVLEADDHAQLSRERHELPHGVLRVLRRVVLRLHVFGVVGVRRARERERLRVERELELARLRHLNAAHAARHDEDHGRAVGRREMQVVLGGVNRLATFRGVLRVELEPAAHKRMDAHALVLGEAARGARLGLGHILVLQLHARVAVVLQDLHHLRREARTDQRLLQDGFERSRAAASRAARAARHARQPRRRKRRGACHQKITSFDVHCFTFVLLGGQKTDDR